MNDRFKFRVWDKKTNKYRKKTHHQADTCLDGLTGKVLYGEGIEIYGNEDDCDVVIEQCTGLKDKNGKLIYEGDIIKIPDNWDEYGFMAGEQREVYFCAGGFRLKPKYNKNDRGYWLEDTDDFEIIGNVHENP